MKKNKFTETVYTLPTVIILIILSFSAGSLNQLYGWNPFLESKNLNVASINDIYTKMQSQFDGTLSSQQALDGAKQGLVSAAGDPYTEYLTQKQALELSNELAGKVSGIGVQVGEKNKQVTVIAPVDGTPAAKAGLKTGDVIAAVDGKTTASMTLDDAVKKIQGKAGTDVKLTIVRGNQAPFEVTITREDLTIPSITWNMKGSDIGYIKISTFGDDTSSLIDTAATSLKNQGAKKVILDLRDNGGGYLTAGINVASEFLHKDATVLTLRKNGKTFETDRANGNNKLIGLPTIVLINGGSASASEIVSGALHDNGAAKLLGEKSFGKGSAQDIDNFPDGSELKVTVAHWFTPDGININKTGLTPDYKVTLSESDYNASKDPQLDAAILKLN